jgi:putative oxygen-independent coproporphyrinogen III oxidase
VAEGKDHLVALYLEALAEELDRLGSPHPVQTLFLGGGTPSHLDLDQLRTLLATLARWLPLERGGEFSLEANPDSFDAEKARLLGGFGVNRVSLGVQSFHPHVLTTLERRHNPEHVAPAVTAAKRFNGCVSLDLIFGVPGQTFKDWAEDLRQALALEPDHISTYGLTFEKGTRLWKQQAHGDLQPLGEDLELRMYQHAMEALEAAGWEQYEISSFARPGKRCRHNQIYWSNESCFGFGVGAAAYVNGTRTLNVRNVEGYIRKVLSGESPVFQSETLGPEERARETLTLNLRRKEGVIRRRFREQTGFDVDALAGVIIARHVAAGLLEDDGECVRFTRAGRCLADTIIAELL